MRIKGPKALIFSDVKADTIEPKTSAGRPTFFMAIKTLVIRSYCFHGSTYKTQDVDTLCICRGK